MPATAFIRKSSLLVTLNKKRTYLDCQKPVKPWPDQSKSKTWPDQSKSKIKKVQNHLVSSTNKQCVWTLTILRLHTLPLELFFFAADYQWNEDRSQMRWVSALQAGMIRMGGEEFFIEPLAQRLGGGGSQGEAEQGRKHVVYRSSAIIKNTPAVNQSTDDFIRGEKSDMLG